MMMIITIDTIPMQTIWGNKILPLLTIKICQNYQAEKMLPVKTLPLHSEHSQKLLKYIVRIYFLQFDCFSCTSFCHIIFLRRSFDSGSSKIKDILYNFFVNNSYHLHEDLL